MLPRNAALRAPVPVAGHCWPISPQETLRHSKAGLAQSLVGSLLLSLDPGAYEVLLVPSKHLWRVWDLILNVISPLLPSCWGFSFACGCGVSFSGGIQHTPCDGCSVASCNFGVLTGEDEYEFYSVILEKTQVWFPRIWECPHKFWILAILFAQDKVSTEGRVLGFAIAYLNWGVILRRTDKSRNYWFICSQKITLRVKSYFQRMRVRHRGETWEFYSQRIKFVTQRNQKSKVWKCMNLWLHP